MITRILGKIYLSSYKYLEKKIHENEELEVKNLLCLIPGETCFSNKEKFNFKQIDVFDIETEKIFIHFDECYDFIEKCTNEKKNDSKESNTNNGVIVFCHEGISRSPTIIAMFLMKKYKLSLDISLHAIKRKSKDISPNSGFLKQLKLFEQNEFKTKDANGFLLLPFKNLLVTSSFATDFSKLKLDDNSFHVKNQKIFTTGFDEISHENAQRNTQITCKICKRILALDDIHVEYHEPLNQPLKKKNISKEKKQIDSKCSHYFLKAPLLWMQDELKNLKIQGKFSCPKCNRKIGGYSWKGFQCSCGKWCVPSIHLSCSKVEKKNF